ncbi:unnamed protein product [Urochloa decumbens]|uniref:Knottins-like domain-containing protein n=1 Tax=Urochloa decumbens TaxID=240449 RepID=A0ABC9FMJ5_9POAL
MGRMPPKLSVVILFLLVLLGSTEMQGTVVHVALARECKSQSHKFKGRCMYDENCKSVCETEGFSNGRCKGFWNSRCVCFKDC